MKGSPHKMGTVRGTSSHASAIKQKTIRQQELDFEIEKEKQRQKELNEEQKRNRKKNEEDDKGGKIESSDKFIAKHNEDVDAYDEEINLLEESGADQKEIDKVRRKRDKSADKLKKGQFDWGELGRLFGDSLTGLGASWGTGRWMGGKPGTYHLRRLGEDPEADKEEEVVEGEEVVENGGEQENNEIIKASDKAEEHAKVDHDANLKGKKGKERTDYYIKHNLAFDDTITDKEGYTDPAEKYK
tara:strand:+ start:56 stop:784 length:729 start_codon:yes stop_codon:yes gene_type:complete